MRALGRFLFLQGGLQPGILLQFFMEQLERTADAADLVVPFGAGDHQIGVAARETFGGAADLGELLAQLMPGHGPDAGSQEDRDQGRDAG